MRKPIRVVLGGWPDGSPSTREVESLKRAMRVRVLRGNGYEHFESVNQHAECEGELLPVYRWCYRTYIAE
jgi:hypothetical protein